MATADAGSAPRWAQVASPNVGFATSTFTGVTCVTATDCWAVGSAPVEGTRTNTAITHWDGLTWGIVPSPNVAGIINRLQAVSCASSSDCWAVGITIDYDAFAEHSLVMHWDGTQWSLQELRSHSDLRGVSCPAVDACWAVGYASDDSGVHTRIEHWSGNAWTADDTSALGDGTLGLAAISCSSASFCMAVGPATNAIPRDPAAAKWDGHAWSLTPAPASHPLDGLGPAVNITEQTLTGVSCTSATDCWAVGDASVYAEAVLVYAQGTLPLVEHWDGTSWTSNALPQAPQAVGAPSTSSNSHLSSVACVTASDCWAVGHAMNNAGSPFDQAFTLHWDGKAWLPGPALPDPLSTYGGDLASIACAGASSCYAVGLITPRDSPYARIEQWDGSAWTSVDAPKFGATEGNYLYDTACPAANDCWAVGFYFYGMSTRTLIEHWDGAAWTVVDSPNTAVDRRSELASVDCTSATDCWAVGESATVMLVGDPLGWDAQALFMHWDGTSWTISNPLPVDPGHTEAQLGQATGLDVVGQMTETSLNSIDCITASDCWAVGYSYGGFSVNLLVGASTGWKALFEHWNGVAWTQMPGPPTQVSPQTDFDLYDISCTSTSDCTAVGSQFARLEYTFNDLLNMVQPTELRDEATLIDHWDGHAWLAVPSPNLTPNINRLYGVSCVASTCWAVGVADLDYSYSGTPRQVPIALQRGADGTWQSVALPAAAAPLDSVACVSATDCWAVGSPMALPNPTKTETLHWDGSTWALAPSPTKVFDGHPTMNWLFSVSCTSGTNCFAVGQYDTGKPPNTKTLVLHLSSGPGSDGCPSGPSLLCGILDILSPGVGVSIPAGPLTVSGDVTLQSGSDAPTQRVRLLLDGVEVGHDDVTASEAEPTAVWSIDTAVAAGAHLLRATWTDGDGAEISSADRTIQVVDAAPGCDGGSSGYDEPVAVCSDPVAPALGALALDDVLVEQGQPGSIHVVGTASDGNGAAEISAVDAIVAAVEKRGADSTWSTASGFDVSGLTNTAVAGSDTDRDFGFTIAVPTSAVVGDYRVVVNVVDSTGLGSMASLGAFAVRAGPAFDITFPNGGTRLEFPSATPGGTSTSTNYFLVHNGNYQAAEMVFQMESFRAASGASFPSVGNVDVKVDHTGTGSFAGVGAVPLSSDLQSLGNMPEGADWAVQVTIHVPHVPGGSYGSSFGVAPV